MKSVLVVVFALCVVVSALPTPVKEDSKEDDASSDTELYIVPLTRSQPRRPAFPFDLSEDLAPPPFEQHPFFRSSPWGAPSANGQVDDFMTQMQEMLKEMRKQLTDLIHRSHTQEAGTDGLPDSPSVGTNIGEEDLPKNKSTSTTKVIDGHVVTVNETTYSSGDDNIGAVFRIKVVEVKPSESPDEDGEAEDKTPESEEESKEPSSPELIPPEHEPTTSKSELEVDKHEETNEIPNQKVLNEWSEDSNLDTSVNEIDQSDFSVEEFSPVKKDNYYDLSGDTKVNEYLMDQSQNQELVMIDPDAEFVEVNSPDVNSYYHYDRVPQRLESLSK